MSLDHSQYAITYVPNVKEGLFYSAIALFGCLGVFKLCSNAAQEKIPFNQFSNEKKVSISVEDYVNMRGKTTNDYDMLQIYKCNQKVPQNTELIVESLEGKCSGIALIPKQ